MGWPKEVTEEALARHRCLPPRDLHLVACGQGAAGACGGKKQAGRVIQAACMTTLLCIRQPAAYLNRRRGAEARKVACFNRRVAGGIVRRHYRIMQKREWMRDLPTHWARPHVPLILHICGCTPPQESGG